MVGNFMELHTLTICFGVDRCGDWENCSPDWEILTRILPHLRREVTWCTPVEDYSPRTEEIQGLARAMHGHPMISEFTCVGCRLENVGPWCSALTTLPSLERVKLGLREPETEDQDVLANPEPLTELLRRPALRSVEFYDFFFTNSLCHATANALEDGSSITEITFQFNNYFPDGGAAIIANALKRNSSVINARFLDYFDEPAFFNNLAAVLLCNSTLQNLEVRVPEGAGGRWLSSMFLSLNVNTTLKSLTVGTYDEFGDELCAAIRNGLAKNSTLEKLSLQVTIAGGDDGAVSARNALLFLRTNFTLKSLTVSFARAHFTLAQMILYVSAFRLEAVKMLEENPFLESLTILLTGSEIIIIKFEELFALISALQLNTTLKTLVLQFDSDHLALTDDEVNQLVSILMQNYGLERIVPHISGADDRTVKAILRLNRAGRRYLIQDGSSISKGVDVLSAVSDEIDCVFLHLLENPGLCDRRAAKTRPSRRRPDANLDESSSTGKREQAQSQAGKEPRRRL
jgi:hypothetical protein